MRRTTGLVLLAAALFSLVVSSGCTLTRSSREHSRQIDQVADRDARAIVEDIDILFMTDRPTRLTRWHDR